MLPYALHAGCGILGVHVMNVAAALYYGDGHSSKRSARPSPQVEGLV
jgi:hypothetical protein